MASEVPAKVRVIIVNYNGGTWLSRALDALWAQTYPSFEVVVVDNGSIDSSLDGLTSDVRLTIQMMGCNLGFAEANNRGVLGFEGRWLATLNPDAVPDPDWLQQLVQAAERHPEYQFFGSTQLSLSHPDRYDGTGDGLSAWGFAWRGDLGRPCQAAHPDGEVFAPCAAAALYEVSAYKALGGFDAGFFCYLEDIDLALRHRAQGGRCRQVGRAIVRHAGSAISGSDFSLRQIYKNQIRLLVKHWPAPVLLIAVPVHLAGLAVLAAWFLRRGKFAIVFGGVIEGLREVPGQWRRRQALSLPVFTKAVSWSPVRLWRRDSPVIAD